MTDNWKPDYIPEVFPFSNVQILETRRWKTVFRFKIGKHLSRKTYVFDNLMGRTYEDWYDIHFITKDRELDWDVIDIFNKHGFRHSVMWEGPEREWYHVIIHSHRMVHKVLRALRNHGIRVTIHSPRQYLVSKP